MGIQLNRNGFLDNSGSNKQAICVVIDNNPNVEPRWQGMMEEGIRNFLKKMQEDATLSGRIDISFMPLQKNMKAGDRDNFITVSKAMAPKFANRPVDGNPQSVKSGLLNAASLLTRMRNLYIIKKQNYYMPWVILLCDEKNLESMAEVESALQEKMEKDELRLFTIVLGEKTNEYPCSFMNETNTYYVDAANRLDKVMNQLIHNMGMVSKSSERARIEFEKSYVGTITWDKIAERIHK